jgi:hypothetical protein
MQSFVREGLREKLQKRSYNNRNFSIYDSTQHTTYIMVRSTLTLGSHIRLGEAMSSKAKGKGKMLYGLVLRVSEDAIPVRPEVFPVSDFSEDPSYLVTMASKYLGLSVADTVTAKMNGPKKGSKANEWTFLRDQHRPLVNLVSSEVQTKVSLGAELHLGVTRDIVANFDLAYERLAFAFALGYRWDEEKRHGASFRSERPHEFIEQYKKQAIARFEDEQQGSKKRKATATVESANLKAQCV